MAISRGQMIGLTAAVMDDMNSGMVTGSITSPSMATISTVSSNTSASSITIRTSAEEIFDRYSLNEFVVEHRVQEFEMMKLRETNVDYADIIKDNLAKIASKEIIKKMTFTKKTEPNTETHSFRGRVWVFTKEELNQMIEDIRNGV